MGRMPPLVQKLTTHFDAWVIGSAAIKDDPRDWDVVVPFYMWGKAAQLIPPDAKVNTFGGWKVISDGIEVDVWPDDIGRLLAYSPKFKAAWHPVSDVKIVVDINEGGVR